jgi:hypothetical protein
LTSAAKPLRQIIDKIFTMRWLIIVLSLLSFNVAIGQVDSTTLKKAMSDLDRALVSKDQKTLASLLYSEVSYGHSNGWVQNKADVINDLQSGKLSYDKIENLASSVVAISDHWATTRTVTNAEGKVNGNAFQFKLHILEVWLKTSDGWQLLARQSTKLQ